MYIIVGLGNPEKRYEGTRHNVGFEAIDYISERWKISLDKKGHKGVYGMGVVGGQKVILAKPLTYMNLSGECVGSLSRYYHVDVDNIIVLFDDISLELGKIRIRRKGSAGGHNGIKSIIAHLGSMDFPRVKIGVGDKPKDYDLADWVLGRFLNAEKKEIEKSIHSTLESVEYIIQGKIDSSMNLFN